LDSPAYLTFLRIVVERICLKNGFFDWYSGIDLGLLCVVVYARLNCGTIELAIDQKDINLQKTAKKVKNLKQTPDF
jgi:hypothetical protein